MSPRRRRNGSPSVDRDLGDLSARVELLSAEFKEERDKQSDFRRSFHQAIESMNASVRTLTEFMKDNKPLMDQYRERRAEARGAARVKKLFVAVIMSISSVAGAVINEVWKALTRGDFPHHH